MNSLPGKSAKKVVFHIGFPKTGSSALQAFLSANAAALDESGVFYPYPEPNSVVATGNCTGNMIQIMYRDGFVETYQRESGRRTNVMEITDERYLKRIAEIIQKSDHETVIFSSELFGSSSPIALEYFKETIFDRHDAKLIGFVRDPFDSIYSAWKQQLKMHRTFLTFAEYVSDQVRGRRPIPTISDFSKLRRIGLDPILVNYDTYKDDIVGKFFEVAGIALPQSCQKLSGNRYNASLTPSEAALVQLANARFPKGNFPATLSKLLLKRPEAERKGGSFYSAEIDQAIRSAVRPVVEDINKNIIGEPLRTTVRSEPDSSPAIGHGEIACLLKAVDTALRATANREARPSVYAWAKSLFSRKSAKLPADFSPEAYLFHNEDVAGAGVDPGLHYLSHGKLEQRRYRFS